MNRIEKCSFQAPFRFEKCNFADDVIPIMICFCYPSFPANIYFRCYLGITTTGITEKLITL